MKDMCNKLSGRLHFDLEAKIDNNIQPRVGRNSTICLMLLNKWQLVVSSLAMLSRLALDKL